MPSFLNLSTVLEYPNMKSATYKIFYSLLLISLFSPLVFSLGIFDTNTVAKTVFFYVIVELALPFYIYLCLKQFGFGHLKNPIIYVTGIFLALSFLSAITGVNFTHSFWSDLERMQGLFFALHVFAWMIYLIFLFRVNPEKINAILNLVIGVASIAAISGILQQVGIIKPSAEFINRATSIFDNPIYFGAYLVIPLFLSLYQFGKQKKYWFLATAAIIFLGILCAKEVGLILGVLLGSAIGVLIYFLDRRRLKTAVITISVLIILGILGIVLIFRNQKINERFFGTSAQERLVEWKTALKGFPERPILGVGPENYYYIANKYFDPKLYQYTKDFFDKPHNYYLEMLVTRGIVGLIGYLTIFWIISKGLIKLYVNKRISKFELSALSAGLVAYLVQNFFAFDMFAASFTLTLFFAFLGLAWDQEQKKIQVKDWQSNLGFILAFVLMIFMLRINFLFTEADRDFVKAISYGDSNLPLAQSYFQKLTNFGNFVDKARIGLEYRSFVILAFQKLGNDHGINIQLLKQWIGSAIAANQKIVNKNPKYYLENEIALTNLYVVKSQLDGSIDPKLYAISDQVNKWYPNRIETDLDLVLAYAFENKADKAQALVNNMKKIAPNNPDVIWSQVYVYALTGKSRLVLDQISQILRSSSADADTIAQLDKIAAFYNSEFYFSETEALYNSALQIYPSNGYFYIQLARTYITANDKVSAAGIINKLKTTYPQTYATYQQQAEAILK